MDKENEPESSQAGKSYYKTTKRRSDQRKRKALLIKQIKGSNINPICHEGGSKVPSEN